MSNTATLYYACDVCGKREVLENVKEGRAYPDGWVFRSYGYVTPGDFCSEACLRQVMVAAAIEDAKTAFAPQEGVTA